MKFKQYPKYKASGVEWLGEVPEGWQVSPLKSVASLINGYPFESSLFNTDAGVPLVRIRDLNKSMAETRYLGEFVEQAAITSDDVLIGMDGDFNVGRWRGEERALLNQRMCCVRGHSELVTRFLEYAIPVPLKLINDVTYFTTVKHLSSGEVERIRIALPSSRELEYVVSFLDRETAKIDTLIAKQEKLIDLLKEKRQTVISHAVTKGLDPTVPMKPSGVEWLGDVPEHWDKVNLGRLCSKVADGPHFSPNYVDEGVMFISARNIKETSWELDDAKFISEYDYMEFSKRVVPEIGDVLYTKGGTTGIARVVDLQEKFQVWVHVAVLKIKKQLVDPYFIAYALNSNGCFEQAQLLTRGATNNDLGLTRMIRIWMALPPLQEQNSIKKYLESATNKIDNLIAKAQQAIVLQKEHRTALISAAVTGKIDVREAVAEIKKAA